jgi:hypothetical protein
MTISCAGLRKGFKAESIAAGVYSSFITSTTGEVVTFGVNASGQLGLPVKVSSLVHTAVLQPPALLISSLSPLTLDHTAASLCHTAASLCQLDSGEHGGQSQSGWDPNLMILKQIYQLCSHQQSRIDDDVCGGAGRARGCQHDT